MKGRIANVFFVATLLFCGISLAQADAKRSITKIAGDLYRFQNNFHYSVFLVTSEGIIVTDPINVDAARWLKAELVKRFNKPIRYMIYSHDHVDHIAGGEVFAGTAIVVAHENAKADIIAEQRPTAVPDITFSDQMTIELGGKRVDLSYVG
ncbi:MAG: MBL fold metallo-hydrolase, partial [Acidiferrobacterales bacterium]